MGIHDISRLARHNLDTLKSSPFSEISGALGDLGTLLPLMIALALQGSISLPSTLVFTGLANIFTGVIFGVPLPVQPMKAIVSILSFSQIPSRSLTPTLPGSSSNRHPRNATPNPRRRRTRRNRRRPPLRHRPNPPPHHAHPRRRRQRHPTRRRPTTHHRRRQQPPPPPHLDHQPLRQPPVGPRRLPPPPLHRPHPAPLPLRPARLPHRPAPRRHRHRRPRPRRRQARPRSARLEPLAALGGGAWLCGGGGVDHGRCAAAADDA